MINIIRRIPSPGNVREIDPTNAQVTVTTCLRCAVTYCAHVSFVGTSDISFLFIFMIVLVIFRYGFLSQKLSSSLHLLLYVMALKMTFTRVAVSLLMMR